MFVDDIIGADENDSSAGSPSAPFRTIEFALERAAERDATTIHVATGTYRESLAVSGFEDGLSLVGGWRLDLNGDWTRDCDASPSSTLVQGSEAGATVFAEPAGTLRLERMEIATAAALDKAPRGQAGGSLYALALSNGSTEVQVHLTDVVLRAGDGGDGGDAAPNAPVMSPSSSCTVARAQCPVSAQSGSRGEDGDDSSPGAFDTSGYNPGNGAPGENGSPGQDGDRPSAVTPCNKVCFVNCGTAQSQPNCGGFVDYSGTQIGSDGTCGCAGGAGTGGKPGLGGGASVALFAVGALSISPVRTTMHSGDGGSGSSGASGSPGSSGSSGKAGEANQTTCHTEGSIACNKVNASCSGDCQCGPQVISTNACVSQGPAGGSGTQGGRGGDGGWGWGGPSWAVVLVDGVDFDESGATLIPGESGLNGNSTQPGNNEGTIKTVD